MKNHPSTIGERTEALILAKLIQMNFKVLIPFGSNQRYDFVVDKKNNFLRIQCKTGRLRNGKIIFSAESVHGHRGKPNKKYFNEADAFIVYCPDNDEYYFLSITEKMSSQPYLRIDPTKSNRQKDIRWAKDYLLSQNQELSLSL